MSTITLLAEIVGFVVLLFIPLALAFLRGWDNVMGWYADRIGDLSKWRNNTWLIISIAMIILPATQAVVIYSHKPLISPLYVTMTEKHDDLAEKSNGWTDGKMRQRLGQAFSGGYDDAERPEKPVVAPEGTEVFSIRDNGNVVMTKALAQDTVVKILNKSVSSAKATYVNVTLAGEDAWVKLSSLYPSEPWQESSSPIWGFAAIISLIIGILWTGFILSDDFGRLLLAIWAGFIGAFRKKGAGSDNNSEEVTTQQTRSAWSRFFGDWIPSAGKEIWAEILGNNADRVLMRLFGRRI